MHGGGWNIEVSKGEARVIHLLHARWWWSSPRCQGPGCVLRPTNSATSTPSARMLRVCTQGTQDTLPDGTEEPQHGMLASTWRGSVPLRGANLDEFTAAIRRCPARAIPDLPPGHWRVHVQPRLSLRWRELRHLCIRIHVRTSDRRQQHVHS